MPNEFDNKKPVVPPAAKTETPPSVQLTEVKMLSDHQFEALQTTILYAGVIAGILASGKRPTPSLANLAELRGYVEGVKALLEDK